MYVNECIVYIKERRLVGTIYLICLNMDAVIHIIDTSFLNKHVLHENFFICFLFCESSRAYYSKRFEVCRSAFVCEFLISLLHL